VHVASKGYEQFPDWPHGRQSELGNPRERCQSSAETAAAGKAVRQANNGNANLAHATRQGLTAKVLLDGEAETLIRLRQLFVECAPKAGAL